MKKIPVIFNIQYGKHKPILTDEVRPGCEWVFEGKGVASVKHDGQACAIINGELYTRYDVKKGTTAPGGSIPCQDEPDPITKHWPHWRLTVYPLDKYIMEAFVKQKPLTDGTYEIVGPHFKKNPEKFDKDTLLLHGAETIDSLSNTPLTFDDIKSYLETHNIEGIVFRSVDDKYAKIRRKDFGFKW